MNTIYKLFNILSFIGSLVINVFTIRGMGPFKPISNISNEYETLITPPDWAFSIWGVIYSGLLLFNFCQIIPGSKLDDYISKIKYNFILSCVFNASWLLTFCLGTPTSITLSVFLIIGLLSSLIVIQNNCNFFNNSTCSESIYCGIPFSLYLGWVISATIINITTAIQSWINISNDEYIYFTLLIIATIIYSFNLLLKNNYVTTLVYLYVLISLAIKHLNNKFLFGVTIFNMSLIVLFTFIKILSSYNKNNRKIYVKYIEESP